MEADKINQDAIIDVKLKLNDSVMYAITKRVFDIGASLMAIIILSPLLLLTGLAIKIEDPKGTVLYHQLRIGKNGREFKCHKFRSMYSNADKIKGSLMNRNEMDGPVFKIRNDPRVTRVGRVIRKTSIDGSGLSR